jgi:hypothetical protein
MTQLLNDWSRRKKVIVGFLVVVLAITTPLSAYLFREMYQATRVYNTFNEDWIARDYPSALKLITPGLDPDAAHKSFQSFFSLLDKQVGSLRSYKSGGINTEESTVGSHTTIHAHLAFERGEADFVYTLKKVQGHWYVDKIDQE